MYVSFWNMGEVRIGRSFVCDRDIDAAVRNDPTPDSKIFVESRYRSIFCQCYNLLVLIIPVKEGGYRH